MQYVCRHPAPPLSEFVDFFWLVAGGQIPRKERILPSGTMELVINLRDNETRIHDPAQLERYKRLSGAVMAGSYSSIFICDAMQHESLLGVHFKPGGAFPFLGAPASELADAHVDLADLWGPLVLELRERLCSAITPRERFQILEAELNRRLLCSPKRHPAVQFALGMFGTPGNDTSVLDAAREVGYSQRRFIQLFSNEVGLTPKLFCRLLRFQQARVRAMQSETLNWARLALTCGYFDQSHLIHDFQEFSGYSPEEYLHWHRQARRLKDNHMPVPD